MVLIAHRLSGAACAATSPSVGGGEGTEGWRVNRGCKMANTIKGVLEAFDDDAVAAKFARAFMARYAGTAFGVLPKVEIDLTIFSLLIEAGIIDPEATPFRIARALNITPAKAKGLLFQYQLRTLSEDDVDHAVMIALTTSKYRKDGGDLAFGVHSPLTYAAIRAKMQDGGVFADISLSGDILKVSPEQFGQVIASLITPAQTKALMTRLRKTKVVDETALKAAVATVSTTLANKALEKTSETAIEGTLSTVGDMLEGKAGEALDALLNLF